jgi:hypothetical protein
MTSIMHFFILSEFQLATCVRILLCKARRSREEVKLVYQKVYVVERGIVDQQFLTACLMAASTVTAESIFMLFRNQF